MRNWSRPQVAEQISLEMKAMWIEWKPEDGEHRHLFDDLGFDSLDGFDFVVRLEETFELHADEDDFGRTFTVKSVIAAVCRLLEADGRLIGG